MVTPDPQMSASELTERAAGVMGGSSGTPGGATCASPSSVVPALRWSRTRPYTPGLCFESGILALWKKPYRS